MIAKLLAWIKANPALISAGCLMAVALLGGFGVHMTATQLAAVVSAVAAGLGALTHASTMPVQPGEHEKSKP